MINIKLGRISIKNFKHISNLDLDFSNKDIIVLDGPNGFGKTTIFDVIELCVTGKISRIVNTMDARTGYSNNLFSGTEDEDTIIKVEFISNQQSKTICKRIDNSKTYKATYLKPDNWEIFETYILEDFENDFNNGDKKINIYNEEILGIKNLERVFNLFYYVQQEDNISFLKRKGKERMDDISFLFDTKKEDEELNTLEKIKTKINNEIYTIEDITSGAIAQENSKKRIILEGLQKMNSENIKKVNYNKLLNNIDITKAWDEENVKISNSNRSKFLDELRQIYDFKSKFSEFKKQRKNKEIQFALDQDELIKNFLYTYRFQQQFEYLKKKNNDIKRIKAIKESLSKEQIKQKSLDSKIFFEGKKIIGEQSTLDVNAINNILKKLSEIKSKMSHVSEVVNKLQDTRKTLMAHFDNAIKSQQNIEDKSCPLCGIYYNSHLELIKAVEEKEKVFSMMLDSEGESYEILIEQLSTNHTEEFIKEIDGFLLKSENRIQDDFFERLLKSQLIIDRMKNFEKWLKENSFDYDEFLNTSYHVQFEEEKIGRFKRYLENNLVQVEASYTTYDDHFEIFKEIFNNNEKIIEQLTLDGIMNKVYYLEHLYYHSSTDESKEIDKKIDKLKKQLDAKKQLKRKIDYLIRIYKQEMMNHRAKIIKDIEIPFYIYSGKIIQSYQKGCGLFISENDKVTFEGIKFVTHSQNDHDAVNYLSSGQLSGLIIAFTMSLNKVYGENRMDLLLIDDPVQTMDEINIASLIELLRNDFKNRQFILSTHEAEISSYIRYKFSKYNKNTMRLNIKDTIYG